MSRLLFGPGARGAAIEEIQRALLLEPVDGFYGDQTTAGVTTFQRKAAVPATGETDETTWTRLLHRPIPSHFDRSLALAAAFEGHGFSLAQGNFDGAGITWGIVGFTLQSGSLAGVLGRVAVLDATALRESFGGLYDNLMLNLTLPWQRRLGWANTISHGAGLYPAWRAAFDRLGARPAARQAQLEVARELYYRPAVAAAQELGLNDELGVALCFDIQVQNGGPSRATRSQIMQLTGAGPVRRQALARLTAASASKRWQSDVLERKLTIATGKGQVHGRSYQLANWGLGEYGVEYPVLDQIGPTSG